MLKQIEFIQDLVHYWIKDRIGAANGYWYVATSPIYSPGEDTPNVRVRIVFYYAETNTSTLVLDMPMTGLQLKWFRDWSADMFPLLYKKLSRAFDDCFEIIGRQVVMRQSFINLNSKYYGKYKRNKL